MLLSTGLPNNTLGVVRQKTSDIPVRGWACAGLVLDSGEVRDVLGIDPPLAVSSAVCADLEGKQVRPVLIGSGTLNVVLEVSVTSAVAAHALAEFMASVLEAHAFFEKPERHPEEFLFGETPSFIGWVGELNVDESLLVAVVTNEVVAEVEHEEKGESE